MKLIPAEEARGLTRKATDDERVNAMIRAINLRIRQRTSEGASSAVIGIGPEYALLNRLTQPEHAQVIEALRNCGYVVVTENYTFPDFRISWQTNPEDGE